MYLQLCRPTNAYSTPSLPTPTDNSFMAVVPMVKAVTDFSTNGRKNLLHFESKRCCSCVAFAVAQSINVGYSLLSGILRINQPNTSNTNKCIHIYLRYVEPENIWAHV